MKLSRQGLYTEHLIVPLAGETKECFELLDVTKLEQFAI